MSIAGIILGGSHVWREDSTHCLEPRLLLPVANVPLAVHTLHWLRRAGIMDVVVCVNQRTRPLRSYLGDGGRWGLRLQYFVDRMPRGPAGCLRDASELIDADQYVVVDGSILPTVGLSRLLAAHAQRRAAATLAVAAGGNLTAAGSHEASPVGVHVFSREAVRTVSSSSYQDIKETLVPQLLRAGCTVTVFPTEEPAPRVSDLATYLAVQPWALERARAGDDVQTGYTWQGTAALHPTASVAASARAIGAAMVAAGTRIADRAMLIGPVVVGRDCLLAEDVVVTNSVIGDRAVLGPAARVDSCLIAAGATVRAKALLQGTIWRGGRPRKRPEPQVQ
jgi:NDP-sugar pyrophosphorylase family protein